MSQTGQSGFPPSTMSLVAGARYLGIGKNEIYNYVAQGLIPFVTYPGHTRRLVTREALDAFRDAHTGTIHGPTDQNPESQPQETTGHYKASPRLTKSREAQLDEVFARK